MGFSEASSFAIEAFHSGCMIFPNAEDGPSTMPTLAVLYAQHLYPIADAMNQHLPAVGAVGMAPWMFGYIAKVGKREAFINGNFPGLLKS